jgi:hypothetical protein
MLDLKMTLLENAFDFLDEAANHLLEADSSPKSIKYAILHVSSAIELLVKQRLYDEKWELIFHNLGDADEKKLSNGNFRSVYFDEAIERLEEECNIVLNKYQPVFTSLKKERNKIEHYHVSLEKFIATSIVVKTWSFIVDFIIDHLSSHLENDDILQDQYNEIRQKVTGLQSFVQPRLEEIGPRIASLRARNFVVLSCTECMQTALPITGSDTQCLFCTEHFDHDNLMERWLETFARWNNWRFKDLADETFLHECPNCNSESLYELNDEANGIDYICFNCGHYYGHYSMPTCMSCGRLYHIHDPEDDIGICDDCLNYKIDNG